eukprot:3930310-Rhodomonas_salina.1
MDNTITVHGSGFLEHEPHFCKFGAHGFEIRAHFVTSSEVLCSTGVYHSPGNVTVSVGLSGQESFLVVPGQLNLHPRASSLLILPSFGPTAGGTMVRIHGANFEGPIVSCQFGGSTVIALVVSSNIIDCVSPPGRLGTTSVMLQFEGDAARNTRLVYQYIDTHSIGSIIPSIGKLAGTTVVTVVGRNFLDKETSACRFGHRNVDATYVNSQMLLCTTPSSAAGEVEVEVSLNGVDYSRGKLPFLYNELMMSGFHPEKGPLAGGSQLIFNSASFMSSTTMYCRFGEQVVRMTRESPRTGWCTTPKGLSAGLVEVDVSENGQDYFSAGTSFAYYEQVVVREVSPSFGILHGNTRIEVFGSNFERSSELCCRFGTSVVAAVFVSSQRLVCFAGSSALGTVPVQVSNNGLDFSAPRENISYTFVKAMMIRDLQPTTGTVRGGTKVTAYVDNLVTLDTVICKFGPHFTNATISAGGIATCRAPPHDTATSVTFELSANGLDWTEQGLRFSYFNPAVIQRFDPTSAPALDASTVVTIYLLDPPELSVPWSCVFGEASSQAVVVQDSALQCTVPHAQEGVVALSLTRNQQDLEGGLGWFFEFVSHESVVALSPNFGLDSGGTTVFVLGNNFRNSTTQMCRFGSKTTRATFLSKVLVLCTSPAQPPGSVVVEVTSNGISWTNSRLLYHYKVCPVGHYCPNTDIIPCPPGAFCRQGISVWRELSQEIRKTEAQDTGRMSVHEGSTARMGYPRQFQRLSTFQLRSHAYPGTTAALAPRPRTAKVLARQYAPGMAKICPPATFCPEVANIEPMRCVPGTSNSLYGQVKCAKCPVGTLCPEYGMQTPVLCPAGYVCDRDGLAVWSRQCPPGYYCLEGTVTANATSLLKPKPIQCGVGTYCLIGSYTNKTKIGDLGTAQPCAEGTYCWEATGSQQGTAPCPKGSYCPAGSASPVPAAPGFYAKRVGMVLHTPCLPGTYTSVYGTVQCLPCASGFECRIDGVVSDLPIVVRAMFTWAFCWLTSRV